MQPDRRRWLLAATILGSSMAFIDGTVVNVALPVLQKSLGATISDAQWIVDAYLLVLSSLILAGGALGDHLGRRRVFATGIIVFAGASLWCGVAPSVRQLIAGRTLQGVGGALLVPASLALIAEAFPAETRGRAIGTWSSLTALAVIAGPVFGGWLVETISWRAVFMINPPIAAATLVILMRARGTGGARAAPASRSIGSIDWIGTVVITAGLGALTYAFIEVAMRGWRSAVVIGSALAGVLLLVLFVTVIERRAREPIVPLSLFRSRAFSAVNALTFFLYGALSAATFLLPFNLIQVQGYSPVRAGAAFLPFVGTMSLLSRWSGALADRIGPRLQLVIGPLLAGVGFALMAIPSKGGSYWLTFFPGIAVLGLGMATVVAPLTTAVMTSIEERHAGAASGINNAVARAAGLLAIALFGAIAVALFARSLDARLQTAPPEIRVSMAGQAASLAAAAPPASLPPEMKMHVRQAIEASFIESFRAVMFGAAALCAAAAGAGLFVPRRRRGHVV